VPAEAQASSRDYIRLTIPTVVLFTGLAAPAESSKGQEIYTNFRYMRKSTIPLESFVQSSSQAAHEFANTTSDGPVLRLLTGERNSIGGECMGRGESASCACSSENACKRNYCVIINHRIVGQHDSAE
jgi:hypothetical protein